MIRPSLVNLGSSLLNCQFSQHCSYTLSGAGWGQDIWGFKGEIGQTEVLAFFGME